MSMAQIAASMLERFGDKVEIEEDGTKTYIFAVVQPMLYKNKMYLSGTLSDAGYFDGGHYLMIAPATAKIKDYRNTLIHHFGRIFRIKKVEIISSFGEDLYVWIVLIPCGEEVADDYDESD